MFNEFNNTFTKNVVKAFENGSNEVLRRSYFTKFSDVVDTTEYNEKFNSTEGQKLPSYIVENQTLPKVQQEKWYVSFLTSRSVADRICISKDVRLQAWDNTTSLWKHLAREIESATMWFNFFNEVEAHSIFNQWFTNLPVTNPRTGTTTIAAPDTEAAFSANHSWNSSANVWSNLLAATPLTQAVMDDANRRSKAFVDARGNEMPMYINKIYVKAGSTAEAAALKLFGAQVNNEQYRTDTQADLNQYAGKVDIISTPFITSDTAYFFVADMDDPRNIGIQNPWSFRFQQRPMLEGTLLQTENLQFEYAYSQAIKFGLVNQPLNMRGSAWV